MYFVVYMFVYLHHDSKQQCIMGVYVKRVLRSSSLSPKILSKPEKKRIINAETGVDHEVCVTAAVRPSAVSAQRPGRPPPPPPPLQYLGASAAIAEAELTS